MAVELKRLLLNALNAGPLHKSSGTGQKLDKMYGLWRRRWPTLNMVPAC